MDAVTIILEVATEKVVKRIKEVGGQDEAWYNPTAGSREAALLCPAARPPTPTLPQKGRAIAYGHDLHLAPRAG
jgi:hypothetical protein